MVMATPVAMTGANQVVLDHAGMYCGFSIEETAGASAKVRIWDNASEASGTLLDPVGLRASETAREYYESGIRVTNGVYVEVVSGAVAGSVRIG